MTSDETCPKHGTPNQKLVLHSIAFERDLYLCHECEAEFDRCVWQMALDEMSA